MGRHNREGTGRDQRDFEYLVSYQPDWLRQVKVTRTLESGRQSTKTLFRNPGYREQAPGTRVRTRIQSPGQGLDFEIAVSDPGQSVVRVTVEAAVKNDSGEEDSVVFTIDERLPPPPDGPGG